MDYKPDTPIGISNNPYTNVIVYFKDLDVDVQISLQNSDKWELLKDQNITLLEERDHLRKIASDLDSISKQQVSENRHLQHNLDKLTDVLEKILEDVDSLKWAKDLIYAVTQKLTEE